MPPLPDFAAHFAVLPIAAPLLAGCVLLWLGRHSARVAGLLGVVVLLAVGGVAVRLLMEAAAGDRVLYRIGNWPQPFGISLSVDTLSAMMVLLTSVVGVGCQCAALGTAVQQGRRFPALLQWQIMGLNGAFLTADLFNLFVFFEVLLAASYALLLDGDARERMRPGLHYVVVNLVGSGLFLLAVSLLYGVAGSLDMADLAARIARLPDRGGALAGTALLLLGVVFGIKAAALPLGFWLPGTYACASAPVAALFAIMTKVGVYAIARVHGLLLPAADASLGELFGTLLVAGGLVTTLCGAMGALGARDLRALAAWLVMGSSGTLLAALGLGTPGGTAAALYYLPHSTLAGAALFLVIEAIARGRERGAAGERHLVEGKLAVSRAAWPGAAFLLVALILGALPPGPGFVGKTLILDAALNAGVSAAPFWTVTLLASLVTLVALTRAGSAVFWKPRPMPSVGDPVGLRLPMPTPLAVAVGWFLAWAAAMSVWARPLHGMLHAAARTLGGT